MKNESTAKKELEAQIKLHINKRLYEMGLITEEMYKKAKNSFLAA